MQCLSMAAVTPISSVDAMTNRTPVVGKFKHSVCRWCYDKIPLEALCDMAKGCGIHSVELLNEDEWDIVLSRGLEVALSNGSSLGIPRGFNTIAHHEQLQKEISDLIPKAASKGIPQIIVFSGNRNGMDDEQALENCATGLKPLVKLAEQYNVRLIMELLNSKINHPDYHCDKTPWGVKLVDKIGSPQFRLLYDIYHMQIMEGDVIRTITEHAAYIAHYHTAGVPGRHEIEDKQELYYPAIMRAIAATGFTGYVAQEFIPLGDPMTSLKKSIQICTV